MVGLQGLGSGLLLLSGLLPWVQSSQGPLWFRFAHGSTLGAQQGAALPTPRAPWPQRPRAAGPAVSPVAACVSSSRLLGGRGCVWVCPSLDQASCPDLGCADVLRGASSAAVCSFVPSVPALIATAPPVHLCTKAQPSQDPLGPSTWRGRSLLPTGGPSMGTGHAWLTAWLCPPGPGPLLPDISVSHQSQQGEETA